METIVAAALGVAFIAQTIFHARERAKLLDRIQAPREIVERIERERPADIQPSGGLLHIPLDDDEAWSDYIEARKAGEVA